VDQVTEWVWRPPLLLSAKCAEKTECPIFQSVPLVLSVENEQKERLFLGLGTKKGADSQRLPEKIFRTGFLLVVRALQNDVDLQ